jgi:hypothetical protein
MGGGLGTRRARERFCVKKGAALDKATELQEIGHSGGTVTFVVKLADGRLSYQVRWSHSRPSPAALFAVYAIPQGAAVDDIELGGMGRPWNPPPIPNCYPVFISSDSTGMFGHECPSCDGYWRSQDLSAVCPYCAFQSKKRFQFLTQAQRRYVAEYCETLSKALESGEPGEYVIDMDSVADAAGKASPKPDFYYAEERQQNLFTCRACSGVTDVLGTYAYCSVCGTRNDLQELEARVQAIRARANAGGPYEACVRDAVAAFDSCASQYAKQLLSMVPLTRSRRAKLERSLYHNLDTAAEIFQGIFGIDILDGVSTEDRAFGTKMFHRRHVYEHKGGEADEKYIADSGDSVRPKQALRETQESAHRTATFVLKLAGNVHRGFHEIFPPRDEPIKRHEEDVKRSEEWAKNSR